MSSSTPEAPAPTALLSFPKSGRTWLKLMLKFYFERLYGIAALPLDQHQEWHQFDHHIPHLLVEHDDNPHFKRAEELSAERERFVSYKVILLVRDPRDIMVSLFFEMTKRIRFYEEWGFDTSSARDHVDTMSDFIRGPVGRLDTLLAYYNFWEQQQEKVKHFLLLRYESMHDNTRKALGQVVDFLGSPVNEDVVAHAVSMCHFDRMHGYESQELLPSLTLMPGDHADPESFKVRRGKVGGYVDYLSQDDIAYINEHCKQLPDYLSFYRT